MDSIPAIERLAGGEVSDELSSVLLSIAQITAADGPKYAPAVCRGLVRWIVCRSYAGPLRELCHLIVAADRAIADRPRAQGYETLFWGTGAARPAAFRAAFRHGGDGVDRLENAIRLRYADGAFAIAYTRMPFLSALMEFVVSVFGYADLDALFRALPPGQVSRGAVDALANDLARRTYRYLSVHLPSVQSQRKFRAVMSFLRRTGGGAAGPHRIDDDAVLAFWIFASTQAPDAGDAAGDFRSFRTVFRLMVAVRDALAVAAQSSAIDQARPIGPERAAGEIDPGDITPEAVDAALAPIHERQAPLDALRAPPASAVKFLKQTETDAIAPIIEAGESALALPLSVVRFQVMGGLQARLTESLRRGADPLRLPLLDGSNACPAAYRDFADGIERLAGHLEDALLASLHHLVAARREESVTVLLYLRPRMDLTPLAAIFENADGDAGPAGAGEVVRLRLPDSGDRFMRTVAAGLDRCPALAALISEAAATAKRLTRKGFKESDWADADDAAAGRAEAFAAAADALIRIRETLMKFTARLQRHGRRHGGWDAQYLLDHDIFSAQFRALYGDRS